MFKEFFHKHFGLPTPIELGKSKRNSLPISGFCDPGDYTWGDWEKEVRAKYPVRYFFNETFRHWFVVNIVKRISHFFYWFRSVTYKRYHVLDLRQPKDDTGLEDHNDSYRWGYLDWDRKILFACFNVLVDYVDHLNKIDYHFGTNDKDLAALKQNIIEASDVEKGLYEDKLLFLNELKELYSYWKIERKEQYKKEDLLLKDWSKHRSEDKATGNDSRWKALSEHERMFVEREDEMLARLMKIRTRLWT